MFGSEKTFTHPKGLITTIACILVRARSALAKVQTADITGCALRFDQSLRGSLDEGALARALSPSGSFTDPYFRAAMRRLGEVSPEGAVHFTTGAVFRPAVPIELEAALSQASSALGFLALLERFVENLEVAEHRPETLRGLVAPELGSDRFGQILAEANISRREAPGFFTTITLPWVSVLTSSAKSDT